MKNVLCLCVRIFIVGLLFVFCNDPDQDNMPDNGFIELTKPLGGETLFFGDTFTIRFKVNADQIGAVVPKVSINAGKNWYDITDGQITITGTGGQLCSCDWIIGSEYNPLDYADTNMQCRIKIEEYNGSNTDRSDDFTVIKK